MAWSKAECNDRLTGKEFTMNSRKRKKKSPINMAWRRGFVCLSLICVLLVQPLTVLADGSLAQAGRTDSAEQADPADAAAQNNTADPAPATEGLSENLTGKADDSTPADDTPSPEGEGTKHSVREAAPHKGEDTKDNVREAAPHEGEGTKDSAPEDNGSDIITNAEPRMTP
jgi:hypothetical protein